MSERHQTPISIFQPWILGTSRRAGIRRFLREFLMIACGVLAALGSQAWWQNRQRGVDEEKYLRQLVSDFDEIDDRLLHAMDEEGVSGETTEAILRAIQAGDPIPFDSLHAWMSTPRWPFWYAEVRPVMGTLTALQSTGDLNLIRNDSIRALVSAYVGDMNSEKEEFSRWAEMAIDAYVEFHERASLRVGRFPVGEDPESLRTRGALFLGAMVDEPAMRAIMIKLQNARRNRLFYLERMRELTDEMWSVLSAS